MFGFARVLRAHGWQIHIVHYHLDYQPGDYDAIRAHCDSLVVCRPTVPPPVNPRTARLDDWCPKALDEAVSAMVARRRPGVLFVQYSFLSRCLEAATERATVKVLDTDNIFSDRQASFAAAGIEENWVSPTRQEEAAAYRRADVLIAVQEREAREVAAMAPGIPVVLMPAMVETIDAQNADGDQILVVGNDNAHNLEGLRRFITMGWPRVRAAKPDARIVIAGRLGRHFATEAGVTDAGVLEDLTDLYRESAIVLNPTPCGTGLKRKTVDALSHGKCLVSTPAGVEGLEGYPGTHIVAHTPEAFATLIVALMNERHTIRRIGSNAIAFSRWYFDPDSVLARFENQVSRASRRV